MKHCGLMGALALLAGILTSAPLRAASYTVSPTGSDSNSGTAQLPWLTLQQAADRVGPGDTVTIEDGVYAGFRLRTGGTAQSRIVFVAHHKGGAKIDTSGPRGDADNISVQSASFITLDGLDVSLARRAGIGVRTSGQAGFRSHARSRRSRARAVRRASGPHS